LLLSQLRKPKLIFNNANSVLPLAISGNLPGRSTPEGSVASTAGFVYNVAHERVQESLPDGTLLFNISPRVDAGIHVEKRVRP